MTVLTLVLVAFAATCMTYGWVKGGGPERWSAAIYLLWLLSGPLYKILGGPQFERLDTANALFDTGLAAGLFYVALQANRIWPLFAAALALIPLVGHMSMLVGMSGMQRAYWSMTEPPSIAIASALALGAFFHSRRVAIYGRYRDWRLA